MKFTPPSQWMRPPSNSRHLLFPSRGGVRLSGRHFLTAWCFIFNLFKTPLPFTYLSCPPCFDNPQLTRTTPLTSLPSLVFVSLHPSLDIRHSARHLKKKRPRRPALNSSSPRGHRAAKIGRNDRRLSLYISPPLTSLCKLRLAFAAVECGCCCEKLDAISKPSSSCVY